MLVIDDTLLDKLGALAPHIVLCPRCTPMPAAPLAATKRVSMDVRVDIPGRTDVHPKSDGAASADCLIAGLVAANPLVEQHRGAVVAHQCPDVPSPELAERRSLRCRPSSGLAFVALPCRTPVAFDEAQFSGMRWGMIPWPPCGVD
jgi:hypothetical protein